MLTVNLFLPGWLLLFYYHRRRLCRRLHARTEPVIVLQRGIVYLELICSCPRQDENIVKLHWWQIAASPSHLEQDLENPGTATEQKLKKSLVWAPGLTTKQD